MQILDESSDAFRMDSVNDNNESFNKPKEFEVERIIEKKIQNGKVVCLIRIKKTQTNFHFYAIG